MSESERLRRHNDVGIMGPDAFLRSVLCDPLQCGGTDTCFRGEPMWREPFFVGLRFSQESSFSVLSGRDERI
jgi:hypothetical protein